MSQPFAKPVNSQTIQEKMILEKQFLLKQIYL